ncbi:MAG: hypothetical protein OQK04_00535 [Kangiellaceae bacterium]|nr:hypothetical protein [Kangiellaceae bacterium]MCW8997186.1 hypothetical protein [Kangiellaceae bacterium]
MERCFLFCRGLFSFSYGNLFKSYLLLGSLFLLMGCQPGSGEFLEQNEEPIETDYLARVQSEIFSPICTQCHQGQQAPLGLRLDSVEQSFNNLVNVTAQGNGNFLRVEPFSLERSFLWLKVTGNSVAGQRMPLGLPPLSSEQIQLIEDWILNGALPSESQKLVSLAKVEFKSEQEVVYVQFTFDGFINRGSVIPQSITVRSMHKLIQSYSLTDVNDTGFTIRVTKDELVHGQLEILVGENNGALIMDQINRPLDFDNNEKAGGSYVYSIQLER